MRKQERGKDQKNTNPRAGPNSKRVIITVYVESPRKRLHQKINLTNKAALFKGKRPKSTKTQGYDRRAELLAYSREMRNGGTQHYWQSKRNSRPKSKMWIFSSVPVRIQASFRRIFRRKGRQFKYERIPSEKYSEVGQFSTGQKRAPRKYIAASSCCRKLKHALKELSRALRCRKA